MLLENENKNVKTIIFSQLPKDEKMKFFNILLENDINFSRDESGNYVALVKVLNPEFYAESKMVLNKAMKSQLKEASPEKKPRSSSQIADKRTIKQKKDKNNLDKRTKSPIASTKTNRDSYKSPLQLYSQMFNQRYSTFFKILNPLVGVRGKKLNLYQLKYNIEEIYSIRFIKDTATLRNKLLKNNRNDLDSKDPFPSFVVEFLSNKFVKKHMIDQQSLDLLLSIEHFISNNEIKMFSKFLSEEYDTEDLIFFLFVRSCIEKEMKVMFIEKSRDEIKLQTAEDKHKIDTDLYLSLKTCLNIANTIFGNEEELLLNSFMDKIEKYLTDIPKKGKNLISASNVLMITLEDYHQSRQINVKEKSNIKVEKYKLLTEDLKENDYGNKEYSVNKTNSNKKIYLDTVNDKVKATNANNFTFKSPVTKLSDIKGVLSHYIKEKELDMYNYIYLRFFEKLLTSYSFNNRDKDSVEMIMKTIKDLVSTKLTLLIDIISKQDVSSWFSSLKVKEDESRRENYNSLVGLMEQMLAYDSAEEINYEIIEEFSQTLLVTPELVGQIQKLVMKHFG